MLSSFCLVAGLWISGITAGSLVPRTLVTRNAAEPYTENIDLSRVFRRALEANLTTTPTCEPSPAPPTAADNKGLNQQLTLATGIRTVDCLHALRGFLQKKNGEWIVQINPTNVKSCGTCKLRLRTTDSGPMWIPLAVVEYGVGDTLDGGLTKLLHTCPRVGGQVLLAGGSATGGGIAVSVSKGSGKDNCGASASTANTSPASPKTNPTPASTDSKPSSKSSKPTPPSEPKSSPSPQATPNALSPTEPKKA